MKKRETSLQRRLMLGEASTYAFSFEEKGDCSRGMRWTSHERRARRSILLLPAEKAINFGFLYKQFKSLSGFVHQATSSVISLKRAATFPSQGKACASRRRLRLCHRSMKLYLYIFITF